MMYYPTFQGKLRLMLPLHETPTCGIVSFINLETKEHFTVYSVALPVELGKLIDSLRKKIHPCKALVDAYHAGKLTYKVLQENGPECTLHQLRAEYTAWLKEFKSQGFNDLRPGLKAARFRLIQRVYSDFREDYKFPLVYIIAVSRRNSKLMLGAFETVPQAEEWVKNTFPDPEDAVPQFMDNEISREYRARYGERFVKLRKKRKTRNLSNTLVRV